MFLPNSVATDLSSLRDTGKKVISGRNIGNITLDVTTGESHTSTLRISENPLESGAVIADHAVMDPAQATITGVMVDYEAPSSKPSLYNGITLREGFDFLNMLPLPAEIKNLTDETERLIKENLGAFTAMANAVNTVRPVAPWLPNFLKSILPDKAGSDSRVAQAFLDLKAVQKSGEPITVVTGICTYNNMLITSISVSQKTDGSAEFTLGVKEVFIVDTEMIQGVLVPKQTGIAGKKKSGKAAPACAPKSQKGKTQTQKTQKKSPVNMHYA